jgi:polar amino acid transport system substrate-binding protein
VLTVVVVMAVVAGGAWNAGGQGEDALAQARAKGALTACADPYNYPFSANGSEPPGFDIEIARTIAERAGLRVNMYWADTGTRGGLGRALRQSILAKRCDFFMGIAEGDEDELKEKKLELTRPYLGLGYVLVVRGAAAAATRLADLKDTKIGVPMSTPVDAYLFDHGYQRALYLRNREILDAMRKGEIEAAMVWAPALAGPRPQAPDATFTVVPGYTPEPGLRWNVAIAVRSGDQELRRFLDGSIDTLVSSGEIKKVVERYGFPYYPPFTGR